MSNYTKTTNFASKDNLSPGNPLKIVKGTEIDTEFNNIQTAVGTKTDNASANITGGTIVGITDLAVADGGTGASTATAALNNLLPTQTGNANKYLQTDGTNATWDAVSLSTADITGTLPVANGGTGVTTSTGTGAVVLSNSPTLVTPALGTPASGTATNLTGLPISTGVSGLGTGIATFLGTPSSANLASAVTDETGSGALVFANSPTLVTPALGTPASATLTNATGLPISTGVSGLGTGVASFLATPSSANLATAVSDETGSGALVFANSPTLVTPTLGTPSSGTLTNATGLPIATGVSGLGTGVATALAVNVGSAGAPVVNGGALGTPSSGTATNLTGLPLSTGITGTLPVANGGTGQTSYTDGQLLIGNSTGNTLTKATLTAGTGITVTNSAGGITIAASGGGGAGDVVGPSSSTDNALVRFDTTTGKLVQNSVGILSDTGAISGLTDISASGSVTLSGGTANGVTYLNGSKVLTSGSALTFDGTNVGVGTNAPAVLGASASRIVDVQGGSGGVALVLGNDTGTVSTNARIELNGVTSGGSARQISYIESLQTATNGAGAMVFGTHTGAGVTLGTEKMRITSAGDVGIGTSSPSAKLHIVSTTLPQLRIEFNSSYYTTISNNGTLNVVDSGTSNKWVFQRNGTEQATLDASGNLGINCTPTAGVGDTKHIEISGGGAFRSKDVNVDLGANYYYDSAYKYIVTGAASRFEQNSGAYKWYTAASGTAGNTISFTQAMTLDSSGNLLLGATSLVNANYAMEIRRDTGSAGLALHTAGSGGRIGYLTNTRSGAFDVGASTSAGGILSFSTSASGTDTLSERARINAVGAFKASNTGTYAASTNSVNEFNTNANDTTLLVRNTATTGNVYGISVALSGQSPNNTTSDFLYCSDSTAQRASIRSNGGLYNYQANNSNLSDRREKTNFSPAKSYLDVICAIPVQTFNYIDQNMEDDGGLTLGVVAQDVQAVAPELVMESNWAKEGDDPKMRLSIYQTDLQYALMKALQELKADFDAYKASHP